MGEQYYKHQKRKQKYQKKAAVVLLFIFLFATTGRWQKQADAAMFLCSLHSAFASQNEESSIFELTTKEQSYLEGFAENVLTVGVAEESMWSVWNRASYGAAVSTIETFKNVFGLEVEVVTGSWKALKKDLLSGNLDFLFGVSTAEAKGKTDTELYYSEPIFENPCLLVVPKESQAAARLIGGGLRLGMVEASPVPETVLQYLKQNNECNRYREITELLDAVEKNELDAAVITKSMSYALYGRTELMTKRCFEQFESSGGLCTAKEELAGIIKLYNRNLLEKMEDTTRKDKSKEQEFLNQYILWKEQDVLKKLGDRKNTLRFAWSGLDSMPLWYGENNEKAGILPEFFQFAEQYAGLSFQEIKGVSEADAKEELLAGDLDVITGVTADRDETILAAEMYATCLIAAVKDHKEDSLEQDIENECYWGALPEIVSMLQGTIFDKSTVEYSSEKELLHALFGGEIGGIIMRQDALEYLKFTESRQDISILSKVSVPVQESLLVRADDALLGALLERLYHAYCIFTETENGKYSETETFLKSYIKINQELTKVSQKTVIWRIAAIILFAAVFITILWRKEARAAGFGKLKKRKTFRKKSGGEIFSSMEEIERLEESLVRTKEGARETLSSLHRLDERIAKQLTSTAEKNEKDALTGLLTESGSWERIREILEQNPSTMAVFAYFDIDNFKSVNEIYGYEAGDEMLVSFSESLKTLEFDQNTIVFRRESDRFGAFRGNLVTELDYRIFLGELQSLSAQVRTGGALVCVTYRCGTTVFDGKEAKKDCNPTDLPRRLAESAAEAMAHCKKNNLHFFQNNY